MARRKIALTLIMDSGFSFQAEDKINKNHFFYFVNFAFIVVEESVEPMNATLC